MRRTSAESMMTATSVALTLEGRLQSRKWTQNVGMPKALTEIALDDMVLLDSKPEETKLEHANNQPKKQVATT